jgi:hypothetical protein
VVRVRGKGGTGRGGKGTEVAPNAFMGCSCAQQQVIGARCGSAQAMSCRGCPWLDGCHLWAVFSMLILPRCSPLTIDHTDRLDTHSSVLRLGRLWPRRMRVKPKEGAGAGGARPRAGLRLQGGAPSSGGSIAGSITYVCR